MFYSLSLSLSLYFSPLLLPPSLCLSLVFECMYVCMCVYTGVLASMGQINPVIDTEISSSIALHLFPTPNGLYYFMSVCLSVYFEARPFTEPGVLYFC